MSMGCATSDVPNGNISISMEAADTIFPSYHIGTQIKLLEIES